MSGACTLSNYFNSQTMAKNVTGGKNTLEIERRYFVFDEMNVRKKLKEIGRHQGIFFLRNIRFIPNIPGTEIRIRYDGKETTLNVKTKSETTMYMHENEVVLSNFDKGIETLTAMGMKELYRVEKLRDIYHVDGAEVVFDSYPGLPPYIEIEASDEKTVLKIAEQIGLQQNEPQGPEAGDSYFSHYGITKDRPMTGLNFETAVETFEPYIKKNRSKFIDLLSEQRRQIKSLKS